MRKLKLQVQMSIDGLMAGIDGAMDWMTFNWDEELQAFVTDLTASIDTIVLGRKLAEGFIPHWAGVAADSDHPEHSAGIKFTETPKVVFSRTLEKSVWDNTVISTGDIIDKINALKKQDGGDIIAYGGSEFVSNLIKHGLIDDLYLFINPVALGRGKTIFGELSSKQPYRLEKSQAFSCGIVLIHYRKAT